MFFFFLIQNKGEEREGGAKPLNTNKEHPNCAPVVPGGRVPQRWMHVDPSWIEVFSRIRQRSDTYSTLVIDKGGALFFLDAKQRGEEKKKISNPKGSTGNIQIAPPVCSGAGYHRKGLQ